MNRIIPEQSVFMLYTNATISSFENFLQRKILVQFKKYSNSEELLLNFDVAPFWVTSLEFQNGNFKNSKIQTNLSRRPFLKTL